MKPVTTPSGDVTAGRRALMVGLLLVIGAAALVGFFPAAETPARYFPPRADWQRRDPGAVGIDKAKLAEAVAYHEANQNPNTRDLAADIVNTFRSEAPYNTLIGPTQERTGANGVIIRRGVVVAEWGDAARADMTFSVTKSFLSTVVGLAYDRGLIRSVHDRVAPYMPAGVDLFASEHNAAITWNHLLRQTSDWSGTLWTKPDWADRPPRGVPVEEWPKRALNEPGTVYKYNDTRVNVLALATLYVMKRPLPDILKQQIMDPIGASNTWHWEAYQNAWVTIDGKKVPSITGGGHFGGGMFISAWDMARFGYLFLNNGRWAGRQLISQAWIDMARAPGHVNAQYGFMNWFLNTPSRRTDGTWTAPVPSAPRSAVTFQGNGANIIYIDWENDLVVVVRWLSGGLDGFFSRVLAAINRE
jgi:CubicO group peptidase (beta-lactamase class C family)